MKKARYLLALVVLIGCNSTTIKKEDIHLLNGYWEISEVIFADGNTKEYKASTVIDFFKVDKMQGYRKKVQPKIGGSYTTNNDADKIVIKEKDGIFILYYENEFNKREEQLITLTQNSFSVKDQEQTIYIYQRYKPIVLDL